MPRRTRHEISSSSSSTSSGDDEEDLTLHKSAACGSLRVARNLITPENVNSFDAQGLTPLHHAVKHNKLEMISYLIDHGAAVDITSSHQDGGINVYEAYTPLFLAVLNMNLPAVELLLQRGANPNCGCASSSMGDQRSPLDLACTWHHHAADGDDARPVAVAIARSLLENGADVNLPGASSHGTPLHNAIDTPELVQLLLQFSADVNAGCNDVLGPPLHTAVAGKRQMYNNSKHNVESTVLLLSNGADPDAISRRGECALSIAASMGDCELLSVLVSHGADVNGPAQRREEPRILRPGDDPAQTPLETSLRFPGATCFLLSCGADPHEMYWWKQLLMPGVVGNHVKESTPFISSRRNKRSTMLLMQAPIVFDDVRL